MAASVERVGGCDVFKYHQYILQDESVASKWFKSKIQSVKATISTLLIDNGIVFADLIFSTTPDSGDIIFTFYFESINKRLDPMLVRILEEKLDKYSQNISSYHLESVDGASQKFVQKTDASFLDEIDLSEFNYLDGSLTCSTDHQRLKNAANTLIAQPSRDNIIKLIYLASKTLCANEHNVDISTVFDCVTKRLFSGNESEDSVVVLNVTSGGTY